MNAGNMHLQGFLPEVEIIKVKNHSKKAMGVFNPVATSTPFGMRRTKMELDNSPIYKPVPLAEIKNIYGRTCVKKEEGKNLHHCGNGLIKSKHSQHTGGSNEKISLENGLQEKPPLTNGIRKSSYLKRDYEELVIVSSTDDEDVPEPAQRKKSLYERKKSQLETKKRKRIETLKNSTPKIELKNTKGNLTNKKKRPENQKKEGRVSRVTPPPLESLPVEQKEISFDDKVTLWLERLDNAKKKVEEDDHIFLSPKRNRTEAKNRPSPKSARGAGPREIKLNQIKSCRKKQLPKKLIGGSTADIQVKSIIEKIKELNPPTEGVNEKVQQRSIFEPNVEEASMLEEVKVETKDCLAETIDLVAKGVLGPTSVPTNHNSLIELDQGESMSVAFPVNQETTLYPASGNSDEMKALDNRELPSKIAIFNPCNMLNWRPVKGQEKVQFSRTVKNNETVSSGFLKIPGQESLTKSSNCHQCFTLIYGEVELCKDSRTSQLEVGSSLFVPGGEEFTMKNASDSEALLTYFKIPLEN